MDERHEQPRDHPLLARYPDSPVALTRIDGLLYRVPIVRERDDAVPVPVTDLVQVKIALHQMRLLLRTGAGDEIFIKLLGDILVVGTADPAPVTRDEVDKFLGGLWDRVNGCLPRW